MENLFNPKSSLTDHFYNIIYYRKDFIRETQISGVNEPVCRTGRLKFVSRTIPMKSEGIIRHSSVAELVSKACLGVSYP